MQELQRTPLAEEVGILAAGDLALRFVEWFGFEELARTGARVNKRWHAASLVFAPPRLEFCQRPGPSEVFDGYRALSVWSNAPGFTTSMHTPTADAVMDRFGICFENGCGAYVIDPGTSSIGSFASLVEMLITENVEGQVLVTMRAEDYPRWTEVFQGKPYYRGNPAADDDFQPNYNAELRLYLWPLPQVQQWRRINGNVWKIVVVDIGAGSLGTSSLFTSGTLQRLARTTPDRYLMCRSLPPGGLAVEEMLLRGLFLCNMAFYPLFTKFTEYFGGLLSLPDRRDTPEKRYLRELLRRDLTKYLAAEFPQTVNVQDLRGTQLVAQAEAVRL